jgi:CubicO group peptidase (beta-lactamase class C family)
MPIPFAGLFFAAALAFAQDKPFDAAAIDKAAAEEMSRTRIPGAAIAVVDGERVVYAKAFGVANTETREPATTGMLFRLGSTTKMMTAAAVVSLALDGKVDLQAPVSKYVAGLDPSVGRVTLHQLLTHTAGLADEVIMDGAHDDAALGAGIRGWKADRFFTEPGAIFSYANPGYWLAGYVAETVSGKPYADVMAERVFAPLGMKRTTLRPLTAMTYPLSQGHYPTGGIIRPAPDNSANWPAGSVYTSVDEFARFVVALLNDGRVDGAQALPAKLIALLTTPHVRTPDPEHAYGYGLNTTVRRGVRIIDHGGARAGFGSYMALAPGRRGGVIVITNRSGGNLPQTLAACLSQLMSDWTPEEPAVPTAIPFAAGEGARYLGVYVNGSQKVEVVEREGRLVLLGVGPEPELVKIGESELATRLPSGRLGSRVRVVDGKYLFVGSRALRKR